jgi:hypothetical protein
MAQHGALAQKRCPASPDKIQYESFAKAREVGDRRERAGETKLYVYNCTDCGAYHLTKRRGDEVQMIDESAGGVKPYSTETPRPPLPVRDERFVVPINPNVDKVGAYLQSLGPRERVTIPKVMKHVHLGRDMVKRALIALGWESHGTGKGAYWLNAGRLAPTEVTEKRLNPQTPLHRERHARGEAVAPRPPAATVTAPDVGTVEVDLAKVKDLTVFQLARAYEAIGLRLTLTVDTPPKA